MGNEARRGRHGLGFPLFAFLVIIVGVVLLLQNLGLLSWGLWGYLWRFWPILIIIIGVNIIFGRRLRWIATAISVLLIVLALGMAAWQAGGLGSEVVQGQFSRPLENADSAAVDIKFGAGELTLKSLPQASTLLVAGETRGPEEAKLSLQLDRYDRKAGLKLVYPEEGWYQIGAKPSLEWEVNLSPRLPLELNLDTGASTCLLDLSELKVRKLDLKGGAARLNLTMPKAAGQTETSIVAGAADITITIPAGVAAKVKHTGISSLDIDEKRFPKVGDYNISPDYSTTTNRINIDLTAAAASIRVR